MDNILIGKHFNKNIQNSAVLLALCTMLDLSLKWANINEINEHTHIDVRVRCLSHRV